METLMSNLHFPTKLYQIIECEDSEVIRWELDGKSFRIVDHERFEREIIPKYFRHGRASSIQRQLNLYGFRSVSRGEVKGLFFHPNFMRGKYDACRDIHRKSASKRKDSSIVDLDAIVLPSATSSSTSTCVEPVHSVSSEKQQRSARRQKLTDRIDLLGMDPEPASIPPIPSIVVPLDSYMTSNYSSSLFPASASASVLATVPMFSQSNIPIGSSSMPTSIIALESRGASHHPAMPSSSSSSSMDDDEEYFQLLCRDLQFFDSPRHGLSDPCLSSSQSCHDLSALDEFFF